MKPQSIFGVPAYDIDKGGVGMVYRHDGGISMRAEGIISTHLTPNGGVTWRELRQFAELVAASGYRLAEFDDALRGILHSSAAPTQRDNVRDPEPPTDFRRKD